ncbi:MAG: response regulator [Bacteriovoracaceae bacterium]|nr:response regulator [Bacteriovoracaceae bacterium]
MVSKILVADDSPTIQKVVRITLANSPYEITECTSEEALFDKLKDANFDLVLLDFTLSENKSGHELTKGIKDLNPKCKVMALLGTFDTVDENILREVGVDDTIVKPFEGRQFISTCEKLLGEGITIDSGPVEQDIGGEVELEAIEDETPEDKDQEWTLNAPIVEDSSEVDTPSMDVEDDNPLEVEETPLENETDTNMLSEEIEQWGIKIPEVIDGVEQVEDEAKMLEIPPVISQGIENLIDSISFEAVKEQDEPMIQPEEPIIEPEEPIQPQESITPDELEDIEADKQPSDQEEVVRPLDLSDKLSMTEEEIDFLGLNEENNFDSSDGFDLEEEIQKDMSPDEFWAVDRDDDTNAPESQTDARPIQLTPKKQNGPEINETQSAQEPIDKEALVNALKESLSPAIEAMVKQFCEKTVEQVAWDVIPDLAENLIKKELENISKSL